jgi:hypothetical protein
VVVVVVEAVVVLEPKWIVGSTALVLGDCDINGGRLLTENATQNQSHESEVLDIAGVFEGRDIRAVLDQVFVPVRVMAHRC